MQFLTGILPEHCIFYLSIIYIICIDKLNFLYLNSQQLWLKGHSVGGIRKPMSWCVLVF